MIYMQRRLTLCSIVTTALFPTTPCLKRELNFLILRITSALREKSLMKIGSEIYFDVSGKAMRNSSEWKISPAKDYRSDLRKHTNGNTSLPLVVQTYWLSPCILLFINSRLSVLILPNRILTGIARYRTIGLPSVVLGQIINHHWVVGKVIYFGIIKREIILIGQCAM